MLTMTDLHKHAEALYEFCSYPAVRYNLLRRIMDVPADDGRVTALRKEFLVSDIVNEMADTQDRSGGWGRLLSKDYSVKAKIPTTSVGVERCLTIGLTLDDRDIIFDANEHIEGMLTGTTAEPIFEKNERALPWQTATVCNLLEAIAQTDETREPADRKNPLCDETVAKWQYIADRAYGEGEYSYEKDRAAQHEVFFTHEDRLIPMQSGLILKRRDEISPEIEDAMLRHLGGHAAAHGHFWDKTPSVLPENFRSDKTRRWMATFNYINQFRGSALYLSEAVEWLMQQANEDGLWDWGPQIKDPWGYFGYFSCNRKYSHNRVVDCTMEILFFLRAYIENNTEV